MSRNWIRVGLVALVVTAFAGVSRGEDATFSLPAMGGFAVSADNTTLAVSLTAKTQLVFIDTVAGKETKRVTVEFQPTQMAWNENVLFVAQKASGIVHILDPKTGKEIATGNAGGPVKNLAVVKGVCFASTTSNEVTAIDEKGKTATSKHKATFIAADTKGEFLVAGIDGKATTDIGRWTVQGMDLTPDAAYFRSLRTSLVNVQGVGVSPDGKQFAVVAGGGWTDLERKRHYSVPLYSIEDMKSQTGELETGAFPCGMTTHSVLPLMFACNGKEGSVFNAKSFAAVQKFKAPGEVTGAAAPSVLAFVGRGEKLAWGVTKGDAGVLKIYDLELTPEQKAELAKALKK